MVPVASPPTTSCLPELSGLSPAKSCLRTSAVRARSGSYSTHGCHFGAFLSAVAFSMNFSRSLSKARFFSADQPIPSSRSRTSTACALLHTRSCSPADLLPHRCPHTLPLQSASVNPRPGSRCPSVPDVFRFSSAQSLAPSSIRRSVQSMPNSRSVAEFSAYLLRKRFRANCRLLPLPRPVRHRHLSATSGARRRASSACDP